MFASVVLFPTFASVAHAQETDPQAQRDALLLQLISLLQQEVQSLLIQLADIQTSQTHIASDVQTIKTTQASTVTTNTGTTGVDAPPAPPVQDPNAPADIAFSNINASVSSNPNNTTTRASYATYTISFDVTASGNDVYIPMTAASTSAASTDGFGLVYDDNAALQFTGTTSAAIGSFNAEIKNNYIFIRKGLTRQVSLTVTLDPESAGQYEVAAQEIRFNNRASIEGLTTRTITGAEFATVPTYIQN